jgi:hypothetical protein
MIIVVLLVVLMFQVLQLESIVGGGEETSLKFVTLALLLFVMFVIFHSSRTDEFIVGSMVGRVSFNSSSLYVSRV